MAELIEGECEHHCGKPMKECATPLCNNQASKSCCIGRSFRNENDVMQYELTSCDHYCWDCFYTPISVEDLREAFARIK